MVSGDGMKNHLPVHPSPRWSAVFARRIPSLPSYEVRTHTLSLSTFLANGLSKGDPCLFGKHSRYRIKSGPDFCYIG